MALVELGVLLVGDLGLAATPEGAGGVDLLGGAGDVGLLLFRVPVALVVGEIDGEGDVVGVLFDDLFEAPAVGVGFAFFVEVEGDGGAGLCAFGGLDVEAGLAVAGPLPGLVFAGLAGDNFDGVGDHEGGIEADAELADEVGIFLGVAGELVKEVPGAGARDGAEVRDEVVFVHADAGVGDGEGGVGLVHFEVDAGIEGEVFVGLVGEGEVAQLVQRVGGVGNELAEKDLRVRVEGVDDELEELRDFGLKFLFCHGSSIVKALARHREALPYAVLTRGRCERRWACLLSAWEGLPGWSAGAGGRWTAREGRFRCRGCCGSSGRRVRWCLD